MDFVLKIGPKHCPRDRFHPKSAEEWIGQTFTVPTPKAMEGSDPRTTIHRGDRAWIWTHHNTRRDGPLKGQGLVGFATVGTVSNFSSAEVALTFSQATLRDRPLARDAMERQRANSAAIDHLLAYTISRTLPLTDMMAAEFKTAIKAGDAWFEELASARNATTPGQSREWSDDELSACLLAYLEMLGKQGAGVAFSKTAYRRALIAGALPDRTDQAIEYRMRNISAVFLKRGLRTVDGYVPAKNVGSGVIERLQVLFEALGDIDPADFAPTDDSSRLQERVANLSRVKTPYLPVGTKNPRTTEVTSTQFVRDPAVVEAILQIADGHCELCGSDAPFDRKDGSPFLEVHHVEFLSDGGADVVSNAVALCPNCHRACHYSADPLALRAKLTEQVERLAWPAD